MAQTIHGQLVLEMTKLEKLEKQEHQWISQAIPSLISIDKIRPHMQILVVATEEKAQILRTDIINIQIKDIHQKVENSSTLTTLTIDIQKEIHT